MVFLLCHVASVSRFEVLQYDRPSLLCVVFSCSSLYDVDPQCDPSHLRGQVCLYGHHHYRHLFFPGVLQVHHVASFCCHVVHRCDLPRHVVLLCDLPCDVVHRCDLSDDAVHRSGLLRVGLQCGLPIDVVPRCCCGLWDELVAETVHRKNYRGIRLPALPKQQLCGHKQTAKLQKRQCKKISESETKL